MFPLRLSSNRHFRKQRIKITPHKANSTRYSVVTPCVRRSNRRTASRSFRNNQRPVRKIPEQSTPIQTGFTKSDQKGKRARFWTVRCKYKIRGISPETRVSSRQEILFSKRSPACFFEQSHLFLINLIIFILKIYHTFIKKQPFILNYNQIFLIIENNHPSGRK